VRAAARARLARIGRRSWIRLAVAAVVTGIVTGYLVFYLAAGSLEVGPQSEWWYPQDAARQVITTADGATQNTVPIRSGQRQGFEVGIYNPTDVTQTVLGSSRRTGTRAELTGRADRAGRCLRSQQGHQRRRHQQDKQV